MMYVILGVGSALLSAAWAALILDMFGAFGNTGLWVVLTGLIELIIYVSFFDL